MITVDQRKIDNNAVIKGRRIRGQFPRSQEWWSRFVGVGTTATVRDDGTVTLEPNGQFYDYVTWMSDPDHHGKDCPVAERTMTAAQKRKAEARLAQWLPALLRAAIVDTAEVA